MTRSQRLTLVAATLGSSLAVLDSTIVVLALPAITDDLGGGLQTQQWISNAYLLTLGALILIGGSLGDVFGVRRIFAAGVILFGVFSVACAAAPSAETLIAARALQGAAAALLTPTSLALLLTAFPISERAAAVGAWTGWGAIAVVLGPFAGGLLVDLASWRWAFALNIPPTLVTLALLPSMVADRRTRGRRVDVVGAVLCGAALAAIVVGLVEQPRHGWNSAFVIGCLASGAGAFVSFLAYERRAAEPMLPLKLFARRNFAIANLQTLAIYAGLAVLFFFLSIFLQQASGWSTVRAGLTTIPVSVTLFLLSRWAGRLSDRYGSRPFLICGPLLAAGGALLLLRVDLEPSLAREVLPALFLFGLGLSATVAPLTATVLADAAAEEAGIASAVNNAVARIAGLLGIAVIGSLVASRLPGGELAANPESVRAFRLAMVGCAALLACGGVFAALGLERPQRRIRAEGCPGGALVGAPRAAAVTGSRPA